MRGKKFVLFLVVMIIGIGLIAYGIRGKYAHTSLRTVRPFKYQKNIEIAIGDKIPTAKDYSENFSNDIVWVDENILENVKKIGVYDGAILYGHQLKWVTLTVMDDEPPIIDNVKDITISVGDSINLEEQVVVSDNSGEKVTLSVKGEYSFTKAGVYKLTYEAIDQSHNQTTADFKLIVKEKPKDPPKKPANQIGVSTKGYSITKQNNAYYVKGILIANKTYSLSSNYTPGGLTKETQAAFAKMKEAALKEGISLKIISGYRSYSRQKTIYNNYVNRDGKKAADRYSARPGHSEHQTGLAFDVNSLAQSFGDTKEGIWLSNNCYKYGFVLRYPNGKEDITGYMYEPWHFRYIGDEAKELYNNGNWITLEEYLGIDSKYDS